MKLNFAYPATGCQKLIDIDDEHKLRPFYEKRMAQEVPLDHLGEEWAGYMARIGGGNDKQGFPMKQGVLTNLRVRLLMKEGHSCYRPRRDGERRRKSVKGCIVDANLSVLHLVIVKRGEAEIPGLTDKTVPRRLGPKRASNIRKMFNLSKEDDVRQYVVKRPLAQKEGKKLRTKAPKIQRLVTPQRLQRKRHEKKLKRLRREKSKKEESTYLKLLAQRHKEQREARDVARRRRSSASRSERTGSASESGPAIGHNVTKSTRAAVVGGRVDKKTAPAKEKAASSKAAALPKRQDLPAAKQQGDASKGKKGPAAQAPGKQPAPAKKDGTQGGKNKSGGGK